MASKSVTVRDVPDTVHRILAARAARRGQSLQEFLQGELSRLAERPDPADLFERIRRRKETFGTDLSTDQILEDRDADRP